ncbi:redox-regulated ATPase YchF, partial [Candidatus Micrarchaeota archaeon CG11_big_fil_rev_8_21_14_0_20_47_5]
MLIGIVGAPNKGKSTFFSAATLVDAKIANYPFTTIEPNRGAAYARAKCPCVELKMKCRPRNSLCEGGTRLIPINTLDVAGLVPGAHEGKGRGNQFLDDLRQADALIQVVDASGGTDLEGNPANGADMAEEIEFLEKEIDW